jgi:hypothetical protein
MEIKFEVDARRLVAVEEILESVSEEIAEMASSKGFYPRFDGSIGVEIKKIKVSKSNDANFLITLSCSEATCMCRIGNSEKSEELEIIPQDILNKIFKRLGFFQLLFKPGFQMMFK